MEVRNFGYLGLGVRVGRCWVIGCVCCDMGYLVFVVSFLFMLG